MDKPKKLGRPRIILPDTERKNVHVWITKESEEFLKILGDGNISAGVRKAIKIARNYKSVIAD